MTSTYLIAAFAPLVGAIIAGFFGKQIGRTLSHTATILGVLMAFVASVLVLQSVMAGTTFNGPLYTWAVVDSVKFEVGFLIDTLTATMMCVVTFVSLMVHIYTIGYMADDPGYQRFFSYISLFTFSMMMLVMSNNFLQLFFGWEAVGLVSYLLIGFWYTRPTAIYANLKAFLVNRVGDFGFALGIGLVLACFGSLDYAQVFAAAPALVGKTFEFIPGSPWSILTITCICLFIGAMGKSAQFPLHVWLPDSMEGPTPISALIHAATMVTAGIFMVSRMSPLFELSSTALGFVIVIGAITALFMGFLGIVQNDIKRVVAYSTLSQLGYMTVALGASAYSVAIFHLMTHAFFKALLFLAAGSVIIGMHHDQDIRAMGGLRKYMPITWITSLLGSLALVGTPFFSGFYSKENIIEAAHAANVPGATFAYYAVLIGVFVTAFYSFRMYFLVFHGKPRWAGADHLAHGHAAAEPKSGKSGTAALAGKAAGAAEVSRSGKTGKSAAKAAKAARVAAKAATTAATTVAAIAATAPVADDHANHDEHHGLAPGEKPHESPWVVTVPLILLAIPSVAIGALAINEMLFGGFFNGVIAREPNHPAMAHLTAHFHDWFSYALHAVSTLPFWLMVAGIASSYYCYMINPKVPAAIRDACGPIYRLLDNKYYMDRFNEVFFAGGSRLLGRGLWKIGDQTLIDGLAVNGSARLIGWLASVARWWQTGLLNHYAIAMILGVAFLIFWFVPLIQR